MADEQRIEAVARALCRHDGGDPDRTSVVAGSISMVLGITNRELPQPRWREYVKEAQRFILVFDAINSI